MKIIVNAVLENPEFPADYSRCMLSLLKHTFENYNSKLYSQYYGDNISEKNYCFSVRFNNPEFKGSEILINDKELTLSISTCDFSNGIDIYNAFLKLKKQSYPLPLKNALTVKNVRIENHKTIDKKEIYIKMASPLLVKKHDEKKDYFFAWNEPEFIKYLEMSIIKTAETVGNIDMSERFFEIVPYAPKKTVVYCYGMRVTANIGIYKMRGDSDLLNLLYQTGIGCKRSSGYGQFEIL